MKSVLVVSSDREAFDTIAESLAPDLRVDQVACTPKGLKTLATQHHEVVFIDLHAFFPSDGSGGRNGATPLVLNPGPEMVILTPSESIRQAVRLVKAGAHDYLTYPVATEEVHLVMESISTAIIRQSELDYLRERFWRSDSLEVVHTANAAMREVFAKIRSVAPTKTTVLLIGETGTGKGVLAKLIHRHSNREKSQFISVHCGAIPDTLLESELFGHEKGAFTGAVRKKLGKFEIARGGTIFLDEIGTISPSAQIKLLEVLQEGTFHHVGGEETIETDARILAATNADLKQMVADGQFRRDLFFRLNVFPIEIPPLRERAEDIPILAGFFLKKLNRDLQKTIGAIHPVVMEAFARYQWPGNIRELENLMERAYILETTSMLTAESFPGELFEGVQASPGAAHNALLPLAQARRLAVEEFEKNYLTNIVKRNNGRINRSAQQAGVTTRQLHKLMTKYGIHKEQFKSETYR